MQFQSDNLDHPIYIKSYDSAKPEISILSKIHGVLTKHLLNKSAIIFFQEIIQDWEPQTLAELEVKHIEKIVSYKPEILILGIGNKLTTLDYRILEPLYLSKTPFEVMTTTNACRTYNLLASEHRQVAAALIIS